MSAAPRFRGPFTSLVVMAAAATCAPAGADGTVTLTQVARDLGYRYAYLPVENAVSLTREGIVIVVRPGDGFFSNNARREPVYGMVPAYRNNDVVVSAAFEREIAPLAPREVVAKSVPTLRPAQRIAAANLLRSAPAAGNVTSVSAFFIASEGAVDIAGQATPGSRVELVLRANLAEDVPVITLDDGEATADGSGHFTCVLESAPDRFQYSRYFVEAQAPGDANARIADVVDSGPNRAAHTKADEALRQH